MAAVFSGLSLNPEFFFHVKGRLLFQIPAMQTKKYKKWFLCFCWLITHSFSNAQNAHRDSLLNSLNKNLADTSRLQTLLDLGWSYSLIDADSARMFLNEARAIAIRLNNSNKQGEAMTYIGTNFYRHDDYDSALFYYNLADDLYAKAVTHESRINRIINKMSIATALLQQGDHESAIQTYLSTIDALNKTADPEKWTNLVTAYTNMGLIYNDLKQYKNALTFHQQALTICNSRKIEPEKKTQVLLLKALDYINLEQLSPVPRLIQQASALSHTINSDYLFSIQYGIEGKYYRARKMQDSAVIKYNQSLHYAQNAGDLFQQAMALQQLGMVYYDEKKYGASIQNFLRSLNITKTIGDKVREVSALKYLSELYTLTKNNDQAVRYYQAYIKLNDSLTKIENNKNINEIESKYQTAKKQAAINELQRNVAVQQSALQRKNTVNITLAAGCCLLLVAAGLVYVIFKNKNHLLLQEQKLHEQQLSELAKERKLLAAQSVLKGEEEERNRLARDLHDGVGGLLWGIKLSMSTMKGNVYLPEESARSFSKVISQLDQSIAELRRVSHNMMPEALIKFGLKEALENYCEMVNHSQQIQVRLQTYGMDTRMEQSIEIVIYRIIQELLTNAIKHADAKNVLIQLIREEDRFNLTVEDDGKGFNVQEIQGGAGLANIKARAAYLNGSVDIVSAKGEGTSVHVEGNLVNGSS